VFIMRKLWSLVLGVVVVLPAAAAAQTAPAAPSSGDRGFLAVHVGSQSGSSDLTDGFTFSQYDETATVSIRQSYGGNPIVNIEGGARIVGQLFAGVAFTRGSNTIDTTVDATIPNPLFFDRLRSASLATELDHKETAVHLFARYVIPVNEKFEIGLSAGPSFISVTHSLVTNVAFQESAAPFTTVTLTGTTNREESERVVAANVGANATYRLTTQVGIDGFFRYAKGATDVAGAGGTVEIKAGGTQFGIGVRFGF
jgi:hypothetical protein